MGGRALIFDMDGTMVDSMPYHAKSWAAFAERPGMEIDLEAAGRLGVAAADCIVFEDAPLGIEAARRAGMRAVAVCTSHGSGELAGPHVVALVRDHRELITTNFLEKLDAA
jgi:beta-phosphoglucomutase-like phosphatase (HAD superfamily)